MLELFNHLPEPVKFFILVGLVVLFIYLWERLTNSEKYLRLMVRLRPKNADAHYELGHFIDEKIKDDVEAEKEMRAALALAPNDRYIYYFLIWLMINRKADPAEIDALCEQMLERFPLDPQAWEYRGLAYEYEDKLTEAEASLRKAISLAPRYGRACLNLANLLYKQNRSDEAGEVCRQGVKVDYQDARLHMGLATNLFHKGRFAEAEKEYRIVTKLDPKMPWGYICRGMMLGSMERNEEAVRAFRRGIARGSHDAASYYWLSVALMKLERYPEAEDAIQKAMELDPKDHDNDEVYIRLLRLTHRDREALTAIDKLLASKPDDFITLMSKASILRTIGMISECREILDPLKIKIPENENYWYNLACVESISGNCDAALDALSKAAKEKAFDREWAVQDEDFQWIRADPRFAEIVGPKPS